MAEKPKGAPAVIFWVESKYPRDLPTSRRTRPMGGKFTRRDQAIKRAVKIVEAGGQSKVFRTSCLEWEEV